jgi:hypothetical protein
MHLQYLAKIILPFCLSLRIIESASCLHVLEWTHKQFSSTCIFKALQHRQYTYKRNIEALSRNNFCRGKTISITNSECVFLALVIHHAMRMRCTILSPVVCVAVPYFYNYLINGTIFTKELLSIKCVFWLSLQILSEIFLILRNIQRDAMINVCTS